MLTPGWATVPVVVGIYRTRRRTGRRGIRMAQVGIGVSIFLIAVGALLPWALRLSDASATLIGFLLMNAGAIGLMVSMIVSASGG
jgi:hypothetical protein